MTQPATFIRDACPGSTWAWQTIPTLDAALDKLADEGANYRIAPCNTVDLTLVVLALGWAADLALGDGAGYTFTTDDELADLLTVLDRNGAGYATVVEATTLLDRAGVIEVVNRVADGMGPGLDGGYRLPEAAFAPSTTIGVEDAAAR